MAMQYHLQIDAGDVAPYVLLPGDPGRVETIASFWDQARHVATNREYVTYTGVYKGAPIPKGKKSLALQFTYRSLERNLTDSEVNSIHEAVINNTLRQFNAQLPAK